MKALILTDQNPDKLELIEAPKPQPAPGMVLVKLKAAALNRRDQWMREGMYPGIRFGVILGSDGAGIIDSVGEGVSDWQSGQEVIINPNIDWGDNPAVQSSKYRILGMPEDGTFAEYVCVAADRLHPKPQHLTWEQAAALPLAGLTAYRALISKGEANAKSKILVTGIGGGVATMAMLLGLAVNAKVFVTSGSDEKLSMAIKNGAEDGFNYKIDSWDKEVMQLSGGFDVIIDSAGGDQINTLMKLLKPGGRLIFYGATLGISKKLELHKMFWAQTRLEGSTMGNDREFADMVRLVNEKNIVPMVDEVFGFDQYLDAFDRMKQGNQMGKIVLKIG